MSKIRCGVVLVVLLLLGTPVLASEQAVAPSPKSVLTSLWSEVLDVVERLFMRARAGDEFGPILDRTGEGSSSAADEFGPILDPNG